VRLGICYVRAGRAADARRQAERSAELSAAENRQARAFLWAALGRLDDARALAAEWVEASKTQYIRPANIALLYAAIGESDRAFEWLEADFQSGDQFLWLCYQWYEFDPIRADPRFVAMLDRMNRPKTVSRFRAVGERQAVAPDGRTV